MLLKTRRRLSKYDLAVIFGIVPKSSGEPNYKELRRGYFTDDVLKQIGLSVEDYRKLKRFDKVQSERICQVFDITEEDLQVIPELSR